jgi:hypothetical protein
MCTMVKLANEAYEAIREVVKAADDLCEALRTSQECEIMGSDFEMQFAALERGLSHLPRYYESGEYKWAEIEEDWQDDAPGG